MNALEQSMYQLSHVFLYPVLLLIILSLTYALFALGAFLWEAWLRQRRRYTSVLLSWQAEHGGSSDDLELFILKQLEWLRITTRSTPMLGLIATMIPMGPAMLALTESNIDGVGENLVVAFSAVILALLSASISFFILTIRRRWLLQEIRQFECLSQEPACAF